MTSPIKDSDENVAAPNKISQTKPSVKRACAEFVLRRLKFLYYLFYWENNWIQTTRYEYVSPRVPASFDGFLLAQVSDLHGKVFGRDSAPLLDRLERARPDLILITGDVVDEWRFDLEFVARFVSRAAELAPVLYITGNHEANFFDSYLDATLETIRRSGGRVLLNERVALERGGEGEKGGKGARFVDADATLDEARNEATNARERIVVAGVSDPIRAGREYEAVLESELRAVAEEGERLQILMSHRPEKGALYGKYGFDLVFAGHAHGGQVRVPGLLTQGLDAPHQGWFPKATSGAKRYGETILVVSRGLGPSVAPTRIFNRPELVLCRLKRGEGGAEIRRVR